jgi:hypothetical protein
MYRHALLALAEMRMCCLAGAYRLRECSRVPPYEDLWQRSVRSRHAAFEMFAVMTLLVDLGQIVTALCGAARQQ